MSWPKDAKEALEAKFRDHGLEPPGDGEPAEIWLHRLLALIAVLESKINRSSDS